MEKIKNAWYHLDAIWTEETEKKDTHSHPKEEAPPQKSYRQRLFFFAQEHRWELLFVLLMGCLLFYLSWILPFNKAPDEEMRYLIPQYIYRHGTLPAGWEEEIRNELWGISYGFHPILPYIFGGCLMKLVSIFNSSDKALLMAARFINILIGMGFYWYVLQIGKKLFRSRLFRAFFTALLAMLPQLLYLFVYVNTDAIAVFSSALIIYYWLEGLEHRWNRRSCTGLAIGVSVCALSYFNAYGYALFSIILFVGSMIVFHGKKGAKVCASHILKRGIFITVLVFLLTGWWFIRCAILYDGDFLGLNAPNIYAELYAQEEYKPSVKQSLSEQGVSLDKMLRPEAEGGMEWLITTYRSTIGYFGFFEYPLGLDIYEIHKRLFLLGGTGIVLHLLLWILYNRKRVCCRAGEKKQASVTRHSGQKKDRLSEKPSYTYENGKIDPANFCILQFSLGCCIIIPILLSMYYSYFSDFQPQGRYIMPMIVPVMYFTAKGTERFVTLIFRKWMVYLIMISLFYAVLHVFLAAFVSVYIPAFVDSLAFLSEIRFPWLSNIGILNRMISCLIPG